MLETALASAGADAPPGEVSAAALQLAAGESLHPLPEWSARLAADPVHAWIPREWQRAATAPGAWFDAANAQIYVDFVQQKLRHTKGKWAGKPFALLGWEESIIRFLFGWMRADGTRLYRRALVWVARKNGKTELAAAIALALLVLDGEFGGEIYAIAKDKKQASIVFKAAKTMVAFSDPLKKQPPDGDGLEAFATSIFCSTFQARIEPLSGDAEGKHGLNCSGLIGDEAHEWADGDLYTFVHQSEAQREQPLEFIVSTAGRARKGYGWQLWEESEKIKGGIFDDRETLVVDYAAPPDADWRDPKVWRFANPSFDHFPELRAFIEKECERGKEDPRRENDFRRYHLNQWTGQEKRYLPMDKWFACCKSADDWKKLPDLMASRRNRRCFSALDLSAVEDISANVHYFPPDEEFNRWVVVPRFWVPETTIETRSKRRVPYDRWAKIGALYTTPGNTIDFAFIKHSLLGDKTPAAAGKIAIVGDARRFRVEKLGIDRLFNAHQIAVELAQEGLPVVYVGQGYFSLSLPTKSLKAKILSGQIDHGGHPVLSWMADNLAVDEDPAGNVKPAKQKASDKIDGIVALIMAEFLATQGDPSVDVSAFLKNPVIV